MNDKIDQALRDKRLQNELDRVDKALAIKVKKVRVAMRGQDYIVGGRWCGAGFEEEFRAMVWFSSDSVELAARIDRKLEKIRANMVRLGGIYWDDELGRLITAKKDLANFAKKA